MADKVCSGDCLKCSLQQQVYCAAQHGHAIMAVMPLLVARMDRIEAAISGFAPREEIINPLKIEAQNGSGAENREPEQINKSNNGL